MKNEVEKLIHTHGVKITSVDHAIDHAREKLDLLRMAYKTKGIEGCADEFEEYEISKRHLSQTMHRAFDDA